MRYLIFCASGIGDFFMTIPCAEAIHKSDQDAHISFFSSSTKNQIKMQRSLLKIQNTIEQVDYYSLREPLKDIFFLLKHGKKYDYSIVVQDIDSTCVSSPWACRIANLCAKKSIGFKMKSFPNMKYTITLERSDLSRRELYNKALESIGIVPLKTSHGILSGKSLDRFIRKNYLNIIQQNGIVGISLGGAPVAIHVNGKTIKRDLKTWPNSRWISLAKRLLEAGYKVVMFGGIDEKRKIEQEELYIPEQIINLVAKTTLLESIAIIKHCRLLISADTGMMHAADIYGTPVLALFGCSDYRLVFPKDNSNEIITVGEKCSPCYGSLQVGRCMNNKCMKNISVNMVYERAIKMLKKNSI